MDAEDIAKKLKPFRQLVDDAAVERELEAELQKDYLFASALHGHKMSLVKQDRGPSPPPAPIQHRKIRRSDLNIGKRNIYFLIHKLITVFETRFSAWFKFLFVSFLISFQEKLTKKIFPRIQNP